MKKASSSSIKNTGDKNVVPDTTKMSAQEKAEKFAGGHVKVENMWGKAPLLAIVDDSISHFAFRVRSLFAVPTLHGGAIALSHTEIAVAMSCSERQAQRIIRELEVAGHIEVSRKHNCRNAYTLRESSKHVDAAKPDAQVASGKPEKKSAISVACAACRTLCKRLPKAGICRTCFNEQKNDRRTERTAGRVAREVARDVVREEMGKTA